MPQLEISTYLTQIFWVLLTFICFWLVMDRFIIPGIAETIDARKRKYDDYLLKAERVNKKALAFAFFPALFTLIYTTIGIWTGPTRKAIDDCPPWSLYKMFMGITWLLSLSALIKGGVPISVALTSLRKDSNRYLCERIDRAMDFIKNGDNLGQALSKSKLNFPDKEIVADLRIYAELGNSFGGIRKLANRINE